MANKFNIQIKDRVVINRIESLAEEQNTTSEEIIQNLVKASVLIMEASEAIRQMKDIHPVPSFVPGDFTSGRVVDPGSEIIKDICTQQLDKILKNNNQ